MCLSIFFASRYLRSNRLRTLILLIHKILVGSLASLVPLRLPIRVHISLRIDNPFLISNFYNRKYVPAKF